MTNEIKQSMENPDHQRHDQQHPLHNHTDLHPDDEINYRHHILRQHQMLLQGRTVVNSELNLETEYKKKMRERGWGKFHRDPLADPEIGYQLRKKIAPYAVAPRHKKHSKEAKNEKIAQRKFLSTRKKEELKMLKEARRAAQMLERSQQLFAKKFGNVPSSYTQLHTDRNHNRLHANTNNITGTKQGQSQSQKMGDLRKTLGRRGTMELETSYRNVERQHDLPDDSWGPVGRRGKVRRNNKNRVREVRR
jgi:hypothetical protein